MSTFTISDWKDAFKTQLEAVSALTGVTVYDAEQTLADTDREAIVLGNWETDIRRLTMTVDEETYTVDCSVRVVKPDSAKSARDRAVAVIKEVKDQLYLDPETNNTVFDTLFQGYKAEETVSAENGRVCMIEFVISVEAHQ